MPKYRITLKSGLHSEINAKDETQLHKKISTGHYGILPSRGNIQEMITPESVANIEELEEAIK